MDLMKFAAKYRYLAVLNLWHGPCDIKSDDDVGELSKRRTKMFRKFITTFIMAIMLAVTIPALAGTASAQRRGYGQNDSYRNDGYYDQTYDNGNGYGQPSVYDRHRKAINIGVATGAGAVIGAIFGGRKGALIGAAAGAVGGVIITKKQRPRNYSRYYPY